MSIGIYVVVDVVIDVVISVVINIVIDVKILVIRVTWIKYNVIEWNAPVHTSTSRDSGEVVRYLKENERRKDGE